MKELILLYLSRLPKDMAMPERVLRVELTPRLRDIPGEGDLAFALQEMANAGWIVKRRNPISGDAMWAITESGREALEQA